jgi:hypothetical protein
VDTDIPAFASSSYYLDDSTPSEAQCTGDTQSFGASGPWINRAIPNTDPRSSPFNRLAATRTIYFEAPGKADGPARSAQAASAFQVSASSFP